MASDGQQETIYAVGAVSGVGASADGGRVWTRSDLGSPGSRLGVVRLLGMAVNPSDPSELSAVVASPVGKLRPMIYWTEDGGQTWQVRGGLGPRRVRAMAFGPAGDQLYMIGGGDILRAMAAGRATDSFVRDEDEARGATIASLDTRFEVTAFVVGESARRGPTTEGPSDLRLYVGTKANGLWVFEDRHEAGVSLVPFDDDPVSEGLRSRGSIHAIAVHPVRRGTVCVGTDQGMYASTDGGKSWFGLAYPLRDERILSLIFGPDGRSLYAGVARGGIHNSDDAGASWQLLGSGLGRIPVYSMALAGPDRDILYAGTDKGLWRLDLGSSGR